MVRTCLRNKSSFAVVAVMPEGETDPEGYFPFANIGTLVDIVEADVTTVGLMNIRCVGRHRVKVDSYLQQPDRLVVGHVTDVVNDLESAIPEDLESVVTSLQNLLTSLPASGVSPDNMPVIKPYHFENAAWVANRWLELLDLPLLQKQRLMQLDSPVLRLELIHDILYENPRNKI
jgi:hypothetical protein